MRSHKGSNGFVRGVRIHLHNAEATFLPHVFFQKIRKHIIHMRNVDAMHLFFQTWSESRINIYQWSEFFWHLQSSSNLKIKKSFFGQKMLRTPQIFTFLNRSLQTAFIFEEKNLIEKINRWKIAILIFFEIRKISLDHIPSVFSKK